jgi:hypothetical protein
MKGFTISKKIKNIDSVSSTADTEYSLSGILNDKSDNNYIFKVKKGFLKNTYTAKITFDASDSDLNDSTTDSSSDSDWYLYTDDSDDSDSDWYWYTDDSDDSSSLNLESESSDDDYSSMISSMDLSFNVTLPYPAKTNNASTATNDNKNLSWNLSSTETETIEFEFELYNMTTIYIGAGVIVLLIIIIIISIASKNKNSKNNTSTMQSANIQPQSFTNMNQMTSQSTINQSQQNISNHQDFIN